MATKKWTISDLKNKGLKILNGLPDDRISEGRIFVSKPVSELPSDGKTLIFQGLKLFKSLNARISRIVATKSAYAPEKKILQGLILFQNPTKHNGKVLITMTRYTTHLVDEDCLASTFKSCGDVLKEMGIIVDDKPEYVKLVSRQEKVTKTSERRVEVRIEKYDFTNDFL